MSTTQVELVKVVNGNIAATLFVQSLTSSSGGHTMELQATGSTLTGYLDGNLLFSLTDDLANPFTSGSAGLAAYNGSSAAFSNFTLHGRLKPGPLFSLGGSTLNIRVNPACK